MKNIACLFVAVLAIACMGADGDCNPGSGKGCVSGDDCPSGEVCDLKTNGCVTDDRGGG